MSFKTFGVLIDGTKTDIVVGNFSDNLFIAITQYQKIGCILSVQKESFYSLEDHQDIFEIRTLLGEEEGAEHLAARYLSEQICIPKSAIFAINLKDNSLRTLRAISKVLLQIKNW
ncbi:proteasome assembly chaperone 3-like [Lycorma delicatula]|uniref:proteasome assembly chaperone 3-like n=1 Tax=Lycorma delicatula TaxID=130591 RepID=UPI003F510AC0